jgi:glycosyltransferase involved in cell wall biosynthesis
MLDEGVEVIFRQTRKPLAGRLMEKIVQRLAPRPIDYESMLWLKRMSPDLVVISQGGPWDGLSWMTACLDLGLKYCPIVHANSETWWPIDEWRDTIMGTYPFAERVFFVSEANRRLMELQCGMRFENSEIVINPWNLDAAEEVPWPEDDGVTRLACVGRVDPQAKGQDLLLQVMAMPKWRERPVHLSIVGGGPCEAMLAGLRRMLGIDNVTFVGQVSDVRSIWANHHALILPSRFEGLPLVIIEAMLCGRPVITTNVAGNAEHLEDGVSGFVAEAPVVGSVDETLERAWARRSEWREMGAHARRSLLEQLPADPVETFTDRILEMVSSESIHHSVS